MCLDRDSAMRDFIYLLTLFWIPLDTIGYHWIPLEIMFISRLNHLLKIVGLILDACKRLKSDPLSKGGDSAVRHWAVFSDISLF